MPKKAQATGKKKSPAHSPKAKGGATSRRSKVVVAAKSKLPAARSKAGACRTAKSARKAGSRVFSAMAITQKTGKTVDQCVATLERWGRQCVAQVNRLVSAGRSYLQSSSNGRLKGKVSSRKSR